VGGKAPLRHGAPRMLGNHGGAEGKAYRAAWDALMTEFGAPPRKSLLRLDMGRVAVLWVSLETSSKALVAARRKQAQPKGRKPGLMKLERLARRHSAADAAYGAALAQLRETAKIQRPPDPASYLSGLAKVVMDRNTPKVAPTTSSAAIGGPIVGSGGDIAQNSLKGPTGANSFPKESEASG
jgi:hypothetical protein